MKKSDFKEKTNIESINGLYTENHLTLTNPPFILKRAMQVSPLQSCVIKNCTNPEMIHRLYNFLLPLTRNDWKLNK